jgi:hypothetical protein
MNRSAYFDTSGGRAAIVFAALTVISLGAAAIAGSAVDAIYALAAVPPILAVAGIATVGLTIADRPLYAFILLLVLPIVAGPYYALLVLATKAGALPGALILAVGFLPLLRLRAHSRQVVARDGAVAAGR